MQYFKYLLIITNTVLFLCSCNNKQEKDNIASYAGGEITIRELDSSIEPQLYEQLFGIYYTRRLALDEVLGWKLIEKEAVKEGVAKDKLLDLKVYSLMDSVGFYKFVKENQYDEIGVREIGKPFQSLEMKSERGKKVAWENYRSKSLELYSRSLMKTYNVNVTLKPPVPPKTNVSSVSFYERGNTKSTKSFTTISDFNCSSCRAFFPVIERLYAKYKGDINFKHSNISPEVDINFMACECSGEQGKYWDMYKKISELQTHVSDTSIFVGWGKTFNNFDSDRFLKCIKNVTYKNNLILKMKKITELGIEKTPTILIDDRKYYGQLSYEKLDQYLDELLSQ